LRVLSLALDRSIIINPMWTYTDIHITWPKTRPWQALTLVKISICRTWNLLRTRTWSFPRCSIGQNTLAWSSTDSNSSSRSTLALPWRRVNIRSSKTYSEKSWLRAPSRRISLRIGASAIRPQCKRARTYMMLYLHGLRGAEWRNSPMDMLACKTPSMNMHRTTKVSKETTQNRESPWTLLSLTQCWLLSREMSAQTAITHRFNIRTAMVIKTIKVLSTNQRMRGPRTKVPCQSVIHIVLNLFREMLQRLKCSPIRLCIREYPL